VTVKVDFSLTSGAIVDPNIFIIGSATQGLIGVNLIAEAGTLEDYSERVISINVTRSSSRRTGPVLEYSAGTATIELTNDDGLLDPYVLEQAGKTAPGALVRIQKVWDGTTYPVFQGYVDSWIPNHLSPTRATITVTASDGFTILSGIPRTELLSPMGAGELTGTRINWILDQINWPTELRDIDPGASTLQETTHPGDALTEVQEIALNELGEVYINASGVLRFRDRTSVYTDTRSTVSQGTFGSDAANGEIRYVGSLGVSWDKESLANVVKATREGGTEQVAIDAASVAQFFEAVVQQTLLLETNTDALGWASSVLNMDKDPEFRITSINLDTRLNPVTTFPQVLSREIGDRITVIRRPPATTYGSIVDERDVFIRSISHSWTSGGETAWKTTWGLQPATKIPFFVIGSPTQGIIGQNIISW
jgi:hypothetical protein